MVSTIIFQEIQAAPSFCCGQLRLTTPWRPQTQQNNATNKKASLTTPWRPFLGARLSSARAGPHPLAIYPRYFAPPTSSRFTKIYGYVLPFIWISLFLTSSHLSWNLHFSPLLPRNKHPFFIVKTLAEIPSFHGIIFLPVTRQTPGYPYDDLPLWCVKLIWGVVLLRVFVSRFFAFFCDWHML